MKLRISRVLRSILITAGAILLATVPHSGHKAAASTANYDEIARFLSGIELPSSSSLYKYTQSRSYKDYADQLKDGWDKFQEPNLTKMKKWWRKHAISNPEKNILYPFSGPDIMNVLTFFPDGDSYTMFGLENPGAIPSPYGLSNKEMRAGLNGIRKSLNTILNVNFFRTKGMAKNLDNRSFSGITGLMMIFLTKKGFTVTDVRKIAIDSRSRISPWQKSDDRIDWQKPPRSRRIPGVEISFIKDSGKTRKVRYFMLNVIDYALTHNSPNFIPFIKKGGPYSTFIKSASYLMHNDKVKFTKIRAAVLSSSTSVVQDDSGIPLRYFKKSRWEVSLHGIYDKPIPLFANRFQADLKKAMKSGSSGPLPFSYGYDYRPGESNLIIARKKK